MSKYFVVHTLKLYNYKNYEFYKIASKKLYITNLLKSYLNFCTRFLISTFRVTFRLQYRYLKNTFRKAWLREFINKFNINRACELKCRADLLLVPAGCIPPLLLPRRRSWRCKAANLWQSGSAVGKTMVASSLTGRSQAGGRKGRKGADRRSKLVGGNRQTHSQPERTSTFLVIKVLPVYLSFRNASIEIFQNQRRSNGGGGNQGRD